MANQPLPPHSQAPTLLGATRETPVPPHWPGTYVPNFSDWREGDIVLVDGTGTLGSMIQGLQSASVSFAVRQCSRWTHAAIYVGGGEVVDAQFNGGIACQSVWNYCQSRALAVRRLDDPAIPAADIADIAVFARSHVGKPYSVLQAVLAKLGWATAQTPNANALYCSTLVGLVVAQATGVFLASATQWQPLYPATLAAHTDLGDVHLEWRHF